MAQTENEIENNLKGLAKMLKDDSYYYVTEVDGAFIIFYFYEKMNKDDGYVCSFNLLVEDVDLHYKNA